MDGLIVSNHGGRQVDGAIGALDALPVIREVLGRDLPVLFDSGIRTGADVFKALALGANAVCLGRPYIWGLALDGRAGGRAGAALPTGGARSHRRTERVHGRHATGQLQLDRSERMSSLAFRERPASGDPQGLLVLHHGRGTDEDDLLPLGDALDPRRRLHVAAPRAPLMPSGRPGYHWYLVPRVGYPDPDTFTAAYRELAAFHDDLWQRTGIAPASTVLGGFSMGSVMSYSLGLGPGRPTPAGILAFSGFVPTVEGWYAEMASRKGLPAFIAHGRNDPVINVEFARRASELLQVGGLEVEYHESDAAHQIDPAHIPIALDWVDRVLPPGQM